MTIILILLAEVKRGDRWFCSRRSSIQNNAIPAIIGSRLVQEICRFFKRKNVEDIYLRYVLGNKEGEKFWEKLGFKPILVTAHSRIDIVEKRSQTAS